MTRLRLIDHGFYKAETSGVPPIYMGGAWVLGAAHSKYPLDGETLLHHLAAKLEQLPLLRQKLVQDPLGISDLRLVEDPGFDVYDHLDIVSVPKPGGDAELTRALEEFSLRKMDLDKPLWHFQIIEGLADGNIAMAMHLHHAVADGIGAHRMMAGLMDTEPRKPQGGRRKSASRPVAPVPGKVTLTGRALAETADRVLVKLPRFLVRNSLNMVKVAGQAGSLLARMTEDANLPAQVPRTSLNTKVSLDKRIVAYRQYDLGELKALCRQLGCTINDLCVLLCSAALEYYFEQTGEVIDSDLVGVIPLNLRAEGDVSTGNVLTTSRINLHNSIADLRARLAAIHQDSDAIKARMRPTETGPVTLDEVMALFSPALVELMTTGLVRLDLWEKFPAFANLVITNVPGPREDIYIAGAPIITTIPMIPVCHTMLLACGINSIGNLLTIGFHGCGEAVVDKDLLTTGLDRAMATLLGSTRTRRKRAPAKRRKAAASKKRVKSKKRA